MGFRCTLYLFFSTLYLAAGLAAQTQPSSSKPVTRPPAPAALESGAITNDIYANKTLGLTCKIPPAWVLRTSDMNERPAEKTDPAPGSSTENSGAKVLLAAFSRPPEAKGEEINSSILIAAESVSAYPDLKEAAQYFGPLTEVAKAQGFTVDEEPYEIAVGTKTLVRGDFHKDIGTRVMRQSTLAMLVRGYAVSITVIAGTEDDIEELIDGLSFMPTGK